MFLQDADGQMRDTHSVAAGLDYVGVSPLIADLAGRGRVRMEAATDAEVLAALDLTMKQEGIIPALESAHAFAQAFKEAGSLAQRRGRGHQPVGPRRQGHLHHRPRLRGPVLETFHP